MMMRAIAHRTIAELPPREEESRLEKRVVDMMVELKLIRILVMVGKSSAFEQVKWIGARQSHVTHQAMQCAMQSKAMDRRQIMIFDILEFGRTEALTSIGNTCIRI